MDRDSSKWKNGNDVQVNGKRVGYSQGAELPADQRVHSWGITALPQYPLTYGEYEYGFILRPFSGRDESFGEIARRR